MSSQRVTVGFVAMLCVVTTSLLSQATAQTPSANTKVPFVMYANTPYAHLMIPVK